MYFDSHAHYDDQRFAKDFSELLIKMKSEHVSTIINVGVNIKSSKASKELANKHACIYFSAGIHPHDAKHFKEEDLTTIRMLAKDKKCVAIGEIGLDFHYAFSPKEEQLICFQKQLSLCEELKLPVIIHEREAVFETYRMIKQSKQRMGVIHAYSGSYDMAKKYVDLGFFLGIGGVITFENAKRLPEVVEKIPLSHLLIETDAPYLTPVPYRGKRNDSGKLTYIVDAIAAIKKMDPLTVAEITNANAKNLFRC